VSDKLHAVSALLGHLPYNFSELVDLSIFLFFFFIIFFLFFDMENVARSRVCGSRTFKIQYLIKSPEPGTLLLL
jgi:hypothetical protein